MRRASTSPPHATHPCADVDAYRLRIRSAIPPGDSKAIDKSRERFGWQAVGYGSAMLEISRSVPDEFRELAEKEL